MEYRNKFQTQKKKAVFSVVTAIFWLFIIGCAESSGLQQSSSPASLPIETKIMLDQVKEAAAAHVLQLVSKGTGKLEDFQDVTVVDAFPAELDGKSPGEIVVYVQFHIGEGGREYYLVVYETVPTSAPATPATPAAPAAPAAIPRLITCLNTHSEYMEIGYCEIVDLDQNGRDEIVVVGDTDGTFPAELLIYTLENNSLRCLVEDFAGAAAYFYVDINGDSKKAILAIAAAQEKSSPAFIPIILAQDNCGNYRPKPLPQDSGEWLAKAFETAVETDHMHRPHIELTLLMGSLRERNYEPQNSEKLQANLEKLYTKYRAVNWGHPQVVQAMAWKNNSAALPFLAKLVASTDKLDARAEAAAALVLIAASNTAQPSLFAALQQQLNGSAADFDYHFAFVLVERLLSLGDRRGIEAALITAQNTQLESRFRRNAVYWVLGPLVHDPAVAALLEQLAKQDKDPEVRRLAAVRLGLKGN